MLCLEFVVSVFISFLLLLGPLPTLSLEMRNCPQLIKTNFAFHPAETKRVVLFVNMPNGILNAISF